ncbi:LytTR family DNA-binding domain-containing protein [Phreatobacter stygius]|nr:LytTR family DNA-binding domain-containing protein [Phreatobacter stygius]
MALRSDCLATSAGLVSAVFANDMVSSPMTSLDAADLRRRLSAKWLAFVGLSIAAGLVLGLLGPFGSYVSIDLRVRLLQFAGNAVLIGAMVVGTAMLARRFLFSGRLPFWAMVVIAIAMAPPGALVVQMQMHLWSPHVLRHVTFGGLMGQTLVINLLLSGLGWFVERRWQANGPAGPQSLPAPVPAEDTPPPADAATDDVVMAKLPLALRHAKLIALSAEDHYLRVHTDRGHALILMGLSQAVEALGPARGLRIHRSHWVARDALAGHRRSAGRAALTLDCGLVLPVSRSGRRLLAEAG